MIDWTHWHNEPYLVGGLIILGWLYALLTGPLRALSPAACLFAHDFKNPVAHGAKILMWKPNFGLIGFED
jgi:hypothetical protein